MKGGCKGWAGQQPGRSTILPALHNRGVRPRLTAGQRQAPLRRPSLCHPVSPPPGQWPALGPTEDCIYKYTVQLRAGGKAWLELERSRQSSGATPAAGSWRRTPPQIRPPMDPPLRRWPQRETFLVGASAQRAISSGPRPGSRAKGRRPPRRPPCRPTSCRCSGFAVACGAR